ncbi:MAG: diaminobutyrate--2-oxoglutarate transaminase [Thermodesulfobacteriota bacterium]
MRIFETLESRVRGYIRAFPVIFESSKGAILKDEMGKEYIDFFAGAGTLNYGHNNDHVTKAMIEHLQNDGVLHGLDMATTAKKKFLQKFSDTILEPRNLDYKIQFTGPTGTNAVESALKLARTIKGKSNIVAFTNGFHGMSMGSLAVTGNEFYRDEAHISRSNVSFMPYDGYLGPDFNTLDYFRKALEDGSSGLDQPAAVILETIQAEGGINVASPEWLRELSEICREHDILLIVDDIQVGNGRSGDFFSFEEAGIKPDIITLSKAIGGGLPLSMVLMRPDLDQWKPGEHTGTFRGNNLAFVASTQCLDYWDNNDLSEAVKYKSKIMKEELDKIAEKYPQLNPEVRGRGMLYGIDFPELNLGSQISKKCFENGLIIELAGDADQVVKLLPPLITDEATIKEGISIIDKSIEEILTEREEKASGEFTL